MQNYMIVRFYKVWHAVLCDLYRLIESYYIHDSIVE